MSSKLTVQAKNDIYIITKGKQSTITPTSFSRLKKKGVRAFCFVLNFFSWEGKKSGKGLLNETTEETQHLCGETLSLKRWFIRAKMATFLEGNSHIH